MKSDRTGIPEECHADGMNGQAGVEVIGVPTNSSGTTNGVALAPLVLRERGLVAALAGDADRIVSHVARVSPALAS